MDEATLKYYDGNAAEVAAKYRGVVGNTWRQQFKESFPAGGRVLDVGSGSGRDLAALVEMGFDAHGCEPSEGMRRECAEKFPHLAGRLFPFALPLPEEAEIGGQYDGVVCSAVFMHVPEAERFDAAFSLRRVLKEKGRLWISVVGPRSDLNAEERDATGRLFKLVHPEYLVLLFERLGFQLLRRWEEADRLGRPDIQWNTFLFELDIAQGKR
jgi:SAM-dependent methyltransferase